MNEFHIPVMLKESVDGLDIKPQGIYVDATYGGGGHSREILSRLTSGKLFAFDQDEEAAKNVINDHRLIFVRHNFKYLENFLRYFEAGKVDGILADLGVSSHDFDVAERGFSFRFDAPLDMRMNREAKLTASQVVNEYPQERLASLFRDLGEIHNASKLAGTIVAARAVHPIITTGQLLGVIGNLVPKAMEKKYLAQLFQALRMEVNNELTVLEEFLEASYRVLKPGGRLVVITYHSLEDRKVKNFLKTGNLEGRTEQDFYGNFLTPFRLINRKVITPDEDELNRNPRSRSAKLRMAEKLDKSGREE